GSCSAFVHLGHNFRSKVSLFLLDALADNQAHEADHVSASGLDQRTHGLVRVLDERLVQQADFLEELADAAAEHLLDDFRRLASHVRLCTDDFLFLLQYLGRHVIAAHNHRRNRRHVHGHILAQLGVAAFQADQHTDLAAVYIGADSTVGIQYRAATHLDVLATLLHQCLAGFFDAAAISHFQLGNFRGICFTSGQGCLGNFLAERQEVFVAGNEVSFGVDFHHHGFLAIGANGHGNSAFSSSTTRFLGRFRLTGFAQVVDRFFDVTVGVDQCLLALHHAKAGTFTQFFHQSSSYSSHDRPLD